MKKVLFYSVGLIVVLLVGVYALLFTQAGNDILKPTIEQKVAEATKKQIVLDSFSLRIDRIDLSMRVDANSFININGSFDLFDKDFDLSFDTSLQDIKVESIYIKSKMTLAGKVKGDMENISILAKGNALKGQIDIDAKLLSDNLKDTKVSLKQVDIKELLSLLAQPNYASGVFDLDMDIKSATKTDVDGMSDFKLFYTTLNEEVIFEKFAIKIPHELKVRGDIKTTLKNQKATSKIDLLTSVGNIKTKNTIYEIPKQTLFSDYLIESLNFTKLEPLIGMKLNGVESFNGDIKYSPNGYEVSLNSEMFSGNTTIKVINDTLNANLKELQLDKILNFLNQPTYTYGKLSLDIVFDSIKNQSAKITKEILDAKVNTALVNKEFNQTLPQNLTYELKTEAILKDKIVNSATALKSSLANLYLANTVFDLQSSSLDTDYKVDIDDLSKLKTIAKRELQGQISITGKAKQEKELLYVDGKADVFDGQMEFKLQNDTFLAKLQNAQISKVLYTLKYPDFFTSTIATNLEYDIKNRVGSIKANSNDGRFKQNELGMLLLATLNFDITKEIYKDILFDANIKQDDINFNSIMTSNNTQIKIDNGYINQKSESISSDVAIKIKEKEYFAKISGKTSFPKVKLDTTSTIKNEVKDKLQKKLEDKLPEDIKAPVKNLLKSFSF